MQKAAKSKPDFIK